MCFAMKTHIDFCVIKDPDPECQAEANLTHYAGNVSVTDGFRTCQRWSDQTPHAHPFNSSEFFPLDASVEDASNYCRNIGGDNLPWCFTTDETVRWQYCSEMICQGDDGLLIYSSKEVLHHLDFFIFLSDILTNKF